MVATSQQPKNDFPLKLNYIQSIKDPEDKNRVERNLYDNLSWMQHDLRKSDKKISCTPEVWDISRKRIKQKTNQPVHKAQVRGE